MYIHKTAQVELIMQDARPPTTVAGRGSCTMFEWDETKRLATIAKHGLDFYDAVQVFGQDHIVLPAQSSQEERRIAVGRLDGRAIAIIYTERHGDIRIVTARVARGDEREKLDANLAE